MTKDELLKRAAYNGTQAAKNDFNHDYIKAKSYSDDTKNLIRAYPGLSTDLWNAHQNAYIEYRQSHRH